MAKRKLGFFEFFCRDELLIMECFRAFVVALSLRRGELGEFHAVAGAIELRHVGNHLDSRNEFPFLHGLPRFFVDFGHDTGDLRLDVYFNSRFYGAGNDG